MRLRCGGGRLTRGGCGLKGGVGGLTGGGGRRAVWPKRRFKTVLWALFVFFGLRSLV